MEEVETDLYLKNRECLDLRKRRGTFLRKGDRASQGLAREGPGRMRKAGSVRLENILCEGTIRKSGQGGRRAGCVEAAESREPSNVAWAELGLGRASHRASLRGQRYGRRWRRKTKPAKATSGHP